MARSYRMTAHRSYGIADMARSYHMTAHRSCGVAGMARSYAMTAHRPCRSGPCPRWASKSAISSK